MYAKALQYLNSKFIYSTVHTKYVVIYTNQMQRIGKQMVAKSTDEASSFDALQYTNSNIRCRSSRRRRPSHSRRVACAFRSGYCARHERVNRVESDSVLRIGPMHAYHVLEERRTTCAACTANAIVQGVVVAPSLAAGLRQKPYSPHNGYCRWWWRWWFRATTRSCYTT